MQDKNNKDLLNATRLMGLGFEFAGIVIGGTFLGIYFDKKFDTIPLFTLIGLFGGFTFGIYNIYRISKIMNKKDK